MRGIILAAGMGTRLRPLTDNLPKGLVKVNGISMVERQIELLQTKGIEEIILVTGYLGEKYNFLEEKYGVKIIFNDKYDVYNNIYSMYLVCEYLEEAYVLDSDVYINNNIFDENIIYTSYFSALKKDFKNEWILGVTENNLVKSVTIGDSDEAYINCGVSYWNKEDGRLIANAIEEKIKFGEFTDMYWDNIVIENLDILDIKLTHMNEDDTFEIDSIIDLKKVEAILNSELVLEGV